MFIAMALITIGFGVYAAFAVPDFVKDCIGGLIIIGIFYLIQRQYYVPPAAVALGFVPILFHLMGVVFGFFEYLIFGAGYDKYVHFLNCLSITIIVFYLLIAHSKKAPVKKAIAALLIVLGIGAVAKNLEFIGSRYMQFTGATMLSEGDFSIGKTPVELNMLPALEADFIVYDYQWDLLFNTLGALVALGILAILWNTDKEHLKHRKRVHER